MSSTRNAFASAAGFELFMYISNWIPQSNTTERSSNGARSFLV
jgi:hypothetical protein